MALTFKRPYRHRFLFSIVALAGFGLLMSAWVVKPVSARPPKVVLFFMDDMGYGNLFVTGALGYAIPNLVRKY